MRTSLLAVAALIALVTPGFAQEPCTEKPKPCTDAQKRAWDREVAQRVAREMNALFAFVRSLDPARKARFNTPFVSLDHYGATGHGFQVSELSDTQKTAFVRMLRALDLLTAEASTVVWTNALAEKKLYATHVRFCAVVEVEDEKGYSPSGVISVFDYGSGAVMPYSATIKPTAIKGRDRKTEPDRAEYLRRATALMKRFPYPTSAPVPESAFLRETVAPWKNLSASQQEWVKKSIMASMNMEGFRWERCSVRMWRTVKFTGGYKPSNSSGSSSGFDNSYL